MDTGGIRDDLIAEQRALDAVVADLAPERWATPTPSPGWNVADQIAHLTYFDGTAALAVRDPDGHGECLALECRFGPEAHVVVIACVDVDHRCCA